MPAMIAEFPLAFRVKINIVHTYCYFLKGDMNKLVVSGGDTSFQMRGAHVHHVTK